MAWETRIRRLERLAAEEDRCPRFARGYRVADKSRGEILAELLAMMFCVLEGNWPGLAGALVEAGTNGTPDGPVDESDIAGKLVRVVHNFDQQFPGLPGRVLDAVVSGAEAITEEMVYPEGRPPYEQGYSYREGERFSYRLPRVE